MEPSSPPEPPRRGEGEDRDELQQREESLEAADPSREPGEQATRITAIGTGTLVIAGFILVIVVILLAVITK